ncbi:MAG: hypothetical protein SFV54_14040 [Bryobacteraceae bacterium]|nr:hypothetical protein [Bryobacteraceae bacterium]
MKPHANPTPPAPVTDAESAANWYAQQTAAAAGLDPTGQGIHLLTLSVHESRRWSRSASHQQDSPADEPAIVHGCCFSGYPRY